MKNCNIIVPCHSHCVRIYECLHAGMPEYSRIVCVCVYACMYIRPSFNQATRGAKHS